MAKRPAAPPQTRLDRAIAAISPTWALKRQSARNELAGFQASTTYGGGYVGGQYGRESLSLWAPPTSDANYDSIPNLRDLRNRSRDLIRNSPIAAGAAETDVSNVVGSGLMLQSRIDADFLGMDEESAADWQRNTERLFGMWACSEYADAYGQQNWYELQELAYRSFFESGDSFALLAGVDRPDWPFRLALQIIEADRVSNDQWKADDETNMQGIERDASQQVVAVHVCNRHPGAAYGLKDSRFKWTRVPVRGDSGRRNVLHLWRKLRPGQVRGIPALAPIIETLKQLSRYSTAEVDAAVNSAVFALFVKMDPESFQDTFNDDAQQDIIESAKRWDGTVKSGAAVNLLPGESIESPSSGRPNPNFDPFVTAVMRQIGMALNIPHEVLTKHFQASYSAARAALLDAWRTFRIRRAWLAAKLCQPVYEEWLADAVAAGLVTAPGFFADPQVRAAWCMTAWGGDGPGALDPLKEAQAAELRMKMGMTTLAEEVVSYDGGDWEAKTAQRQREVDARIDAGLELELTPDPGTPGAPMPGAPSDGGGAPNDPIEPPDDGEDD